MRAIHIHRLIVEVDASFENTRTPADRVGRRSMIVPVIETDRLILRGHTIDDFAASYAMWSDPTVTRFIGGKPSTEAQAWSRLMNYVGHWHLMRFGYWAVEEKASRLFIGEVGFADFKRDIHPAMRDTPELGWVLAPHAHGNGYATEAAGAAVRWADRRFDGGRTVCMIDPENAASLRVAEKIGFREFTRTTFNDSRVGLFERVRAPEH